MTVRVVRCEKTASNRICGRLENEVSAAMWPWARCCSSRRNISVPHLRAVFVPGQAHGRHGGGAGYDETVESHVAGAGDDGHQFIEDQLQTLFQARLRRVELAQRDDEVRAQVFDHRHQQLLLAAEVAVGGSHPPRPRWHPC